MSWIFYERLSVRSINSSLPLPNKYFSQILNVARCTKIEKRFWLVCIMHVLGTFLLAVIVNYYTCFSWLFLIQTDFQDQTQFWMWRKYETHGNKSNKVKFIVIGVLKLVIHSCHCFLFRLNCVLLRYFRIHSFHQDHKMLQQHVYLPKFCINKLFNPFLRYLLGRLDTQEKLGGRKGVAPLCGPSEYVLSIKVWCLRSSQNKVWALAIRSL